MKSNKLLLSVLAFSVATSAIVVPFTDTASAESTINTYDKTFKDVSKDHPYYNDIQTMVEQGIISGYEDGTLRLNETMSRKQAAALINRAVDVTNTISYLHQLANTTKLAEPKDVSHKNPNYNDIKAILDAGIMELDKNGNFNPNDALSRGEMAKILVNAFDLTTNQLKTRPFRDVSSNYRVYAEVLYANHIATGYEDGTFKENNKLTRAHFALFMYRAINVEDYLTKEEAELVNKLNYERRLQAEDRLVLTEEEKEYIKIGESLIIYNTKLENILSPEGISSKEQHTKWNKIRVREKHKGMSKWNLNVSYSAEYLGETIVTKAKYAHITAKEMAEIINNAIKTGEVYDGGYYALYYNYDEGALYQSVGVGWGE